MSTLTAEAPAVTDLATVHPETLRVAEAFVSLRGEKAVAFLLQIADNHPDVRDAFEEFADLATAIRAERSVRSPG